MVVVIEEGAKQYLVKKHDVLMIEKIDAEVGSLVDLKNVLYSINSSDKLSDTSHIKVVAEVLEHKRTKKVLVFKKKRRHNYRRKNGHRQNITVLRIRDIVSDV